MIKLFTIVFGTCTLFSVLMFVDPIQSQSSNTASQSTNSIQTPIIATIGVISGAALTAIASAYAAQQKIKEIQIQYSLKLEEVKLLYNQKLRDNYLANARLYTNNIYVPISIALRSLNDEYTVFKSQLDISTGQVEQAVSESFCNSCNKYADIMADLFERGADAFLTPELDEKLRSFNIFLKMSLQSTDPIIKVKLEVRMNFFISKFLGFVKVPLIKEVRGRLPVFINSSGSTSFDLFGYGLTANVEEVLAAPINSTEFEQRITIDILNLKLLVKEVTLGGNPSFDK